MELAWSWLAAQVQAIAGPKTKIAAMSVITKPALTNSMTVDGSTTNELIFGLWRSSQVLPNKSPKAMTGMTAIRIGLLMGHGSRLFQTAQAKNTRMIGTATFG